MESPLETARLDQPRSFSWPGAGYVLLGLGLGVVLIAAGDRVYVLQGSVSSLASILPLGYAFGAGMVATVNPCGILLLPSLVAYYLSSGGTATLSGWKRTEKALVLSLMATLGFVALFAVVGLVIGAGGRALAVVFPFGGLLMGIALAVGGAWLALSDRGFGVLAFGRAMGAVHLTQDPRSQFVFGVSYAVCSLSCTLPIFLVVAGSALIAGGPVAAVAQFTSYALGMGAILTVVILGATFFQGVMTRWVRAIVPYVHRLAASFLIGAGLYIVHYWLVAIGFLG
ncbi:MAG TPA: cytochrome c biogenesis protein CcdA [Chloroflexota bacterium]|nr:cytochrome c biogenesis protein CcdA [Chloroflexota bacterium]